MTPALPQPCHRRSGARGRWLRLLATTLALAGMMAAAAQAPRLIVQTGHSQTTAATWSADGELVASGGTDGSVVLWDAATGRQLHTLEGPPGTLETLQFSADRSLLMTGTTDGRIMAWDVATGRVQASTPVGNAPIKSLTASADGSVLMVALGSSVVVIDIARKQTTNIDLAASVVVTAALSPDSTTVAVAKWRGGTLLFDARTGMQRHELATQGSGVQALKFSPDGRLLASGSEDGAIRLWDANSGALVRDIGAHGHGIETVDFSADGRLLASAGVTLRLWDVATGAQVATSIRPGQYLKRALFSPGGDRILALDSSGMEIWDVGSGERLRELRGRAGQAHRLAFSPDGQRLIVGGSVWDLASGRSQPTFMHDSPETYLQWSGDGTRVLGAGPGGPTLWDPASWTGVLTLRVQDDTEIAAALSPDGRQVAAALASGKLRFWDAASGQATGDWTVHDRAVRQVDYSPDGRWLAAGGRDGPVTLWRVRDGRKMHDTGDRRPSAFRFTPDGRALALAWLDGSVTMHALGDAATLPAVAHGAAVDVLRYSPDGRWLATGGMDHGIKVWDAATGKLLHTLAGHDDGVRDVAFSPDGALVASVSRDATARLWSRESGKLVATLVQMSRPQVWSSSSVVVAPDGRFDAQELEGLQGLHWLLPAAPLRPVPLEAFMRDYYEPRLLPRLLSGEAMPPVAAVTEIDTRAPVVAITAVKADPEDKNRVEVVIEVSPAPSAETAAPGAQDLRLFRDGQLVGYVDGPLEADPKSGKTRVTRSVRLPGSKGGRGVEFSAYAFNSDRVKSETAYKLHAVEWMVPLPPRRAILVNIGVDIYQSPAWDLGFAASDARLIGTMLATRLRALGDFDEVVQIELVSDLDTPEAASKAAIRDALLGLSKGVGQAGPVGPDDLVVISFSGHGAVDQQGAFYLMPHDIGEVASRLVTPALLARGIRDDELGGWLRGVDAGEMILILDACHSAASVAQPGFKPGPMGSRGLGQLAYDKGIRILAATQPNDVALESEATQHGLLSYALMKEGIEQGQADFRPKDQSIVLSEWLGYALERVPALAAEVQSGTVASRGGPAPRVRNASGLAGANATPGLQRPSLFDFRRAPVDVEIAKP